MLKQMIEFPNFLQKKSTDNKQNLITLLLLLSVTMTTCNNKKLLLTYCGKNPPTTPTPLNLTNVSYLICLTCTKKWQFVKVILWS